MIEAKMNMCALLCAATAGLAMPTDAQAQAQCVAPQVERRLTSCQGAAPPSTLSRPGQSAASLAASPEPERASRAQPTPETFELRVPGLPGGRARQRRLIEREVSTLSRLRRNTRASDARHADVLERLATTLGEFVYLEESRAARLEQTRFEARQSRDRAAVTRATRAQTAARRAAREHRELAVRVLAELVAAHPDRPALDSALFTLAYHLGRMDEHARARQVYHRLIRGFPSSRFVAQAYLAFADHYFEQGDLSAAAQFYERVLEIPPERNAVHGYARYKLAWVRFNEEAFRPSLDAFVALIHDAASHPERPQMGPLGRAARREIVLPYARVGRPDRALAFFERVACEGREAAECEPEAREMFESLGSLYHDTGRWAESVQVHHALMADAPDDASLCQWQMRVFEATVASRPADERVREATRLADVRRAFASSEQSASDIAACSDATATALVVLAAAWHREAVGTAESPGTRSSATMRQAAAVYALVEGIEGFADLPLTRIEAEDRPSLGHLAYYRAELLFTLQSWEAAAEAYEAAIERTDDPQLQADAAYAAVLAYDRVLGERTPPATASDRALTRRELSPTEARMARTFERFACSAPDHEDLPVVLYRWARLHYEANQLAEASVIFGRVAFEHGDSEVGEYAANLYLDSLNMLGERRERTSCFETLRAALPRMDHAFCEDPGTRATHGELCVTLDRLHCSTGAQGADQLGSEGHHRRAAEAYVGLVRGPRRCPQAPLYLYNAAIHFEAARLIGRAIRVRRALIDAFPDDALARRAIHMVGGNYHAIAVYSEAASWYERYVTDGGRCVPDEHPCPDAAEGLRHAVVFRLGLGERERALEDAALFARRFARPHPRLTAEVAFAIGAVHEQAGAWPQLVDHYRRFLRQHARRATPAQLARANVLIARGWIEQGRTDRAGPSLEAAIAVFERGGEEAVAQLDVSEEAQLAERVQLRDAVAEARYLRAESARAEFERLRFPTLRGRLSLARVNRWAESDLTPWITEARARLGTAEALYSEVAALEVPRWNIAAASRIGDMYLSIVERLRDAPIPDVISDDPELFDIYTRNIDEAWAPLLVTATSRFEFCLGTATRLRWFDERSERCETALNRLDAARYPVAAELRGRAEYAVADGVLPSSPRLDLEP